MIRKIVAYAKLDLTSDVALNKLVSWVKFSKK